VPEVDDAQRQERRKKAGDLLKMADKLFKGSDFEGAARLVQMAMDTDPHNAYALAYQERVKYAIAQRDSPRLETPKPVGAETAPHPSPEEIKKKLEEAQRKIAEEHARESAAPQKPPEPEPAPKATPPVAAEVPPAVRVDVTALQKNLEEAIRGRALLQKNLDDTVRERSALQMEIETLRAEVEGIHKTAEAERLKHQADGNVQHSEWELRLDDERKRLEKQRAESEQRLEAAAKTLRMQLEEGVHARATLQKQIQELQSRLDHMHTSTAEERERLESGGDAIRAQMQELEAERKNLQDENQGLRNRLELTGAQVQQERQEFESKQARDIEALHTELEHRVAEEHRRYVQVEENAERRLESVTVALRKQIEEITQNRDAALKQVTALEEQINDLQRSFDEERNAWLSEKEGERQIVEQEWGQRLEDERARGESLAAEINQQLANLTGHKRSLEEQLRSLQQQHQELTARTSEELHQWQSERETLLGSLRAEEDKVIQERRHMEEEHARRVEADLEAWEARLQEERAKWDNEHKAAERALQARHIAEIGSLKEQLQAASQFRRQEETQALQDLRRTLEQEYAQRFEAAQKRFQDERQRMELEMQSRLAAELHRQEDLRRERDELVTQLDGYRATADTERRRLEEELRNRVLVERAEAAEEVRERLEARFEQEREALQRTTRAAVESELQVRFDEERTTLVREQQRLEDELRRVNDKQQTEEEEGEASRSQADEFQRRLTEEHRVHEKRSQEALDAAQQRWKMDQERQVEEIRTKLISEYERKLEEEHQSAQDQRNRDHYEALEARRDIEEQLRREFETTLMNRLKEERERFQNEYQDRLEAERTRVESELRSAFEAEAQRRSDEDDRIAREERRDREAEDAERRKQEEARKYEEAVRVAIEEGRQKARQRKIATYLEQARQLMEKSRFSQALEEVSRVLALEPSHEEAHTLENAIRSAQARQDRRQEELSRLQEEQKRRVQEIQTKLKAQQQKDHQQEKERAVREQTVAQRITRASEYRRLGALDKALNEVQAILAIDPGNSEAQDMEISILTQVNGHKEVRAAVARRTELGEAWQGEQPVHDEQEGTQRERIREESSQVYRNMLKRAWMRGIPGRDTGAMLDVARVSLGISENDHALLQTQVQLEVYREALEMALGASLLDATDEDALEGIRNKYGIDIQAHEAIMSSHRRRP
jgi:hypothetical protein